MSEPEAKLTVKDGGWVLILLAIVIIAIISWAVLPAILGLGNHSAGDGKSIDSYLFDMNGYALPLESTVPAMQHRDMSPVLQDPEIFSPEEIAASNQSKRDKYIVSGDLVVGVEIGGEERAYPLHVLNVHEVINDTVGGVPITVYWNWPSGHVSVFNRTIENEPQNFGVSGLSGNGTMLLYIDSQQEGGEQLWSIMKHASVSGDPHTLEQIPHEVTSWGNWSEQHPNTTAVAPVEQFKKRYRKGDPKTYFLNDTIYFPTSPEPNTTIHPKTIVIVLPTTEGFTAIPMQWLVEQSTDGEVQLVVDGQEILFEVENSPLCAVARNTNGELLPSQRALWFTWYANHPNTVLMHE